MTIAREIRCSTCGAPLSVSAHEVDPPSCLYCGAASSLTRPRAFHPLRRDEELWSTPHRAAPAQPTPAHHAPAHHAPAQHAPTVTATTSPHAHEASPVATDALRVELTRIGPNRIAALKAVRLLTEIGLSEAMRMIEALPATLAVINRELSPGDVERALRDAGCEFTLSSGAQVAAAPAQPAQPQAAEVGQVTAEHGEWSIVLESVWPHHKIDAIKLLRECSGWGLLESKNAVEAPGGLVPLSAGQSLDNLRMRFEAIKCAVTFKRGNW
ncbi:MAG: ribosomal protein L7/L12 [Polyangiales bacterium]